VLDLAEYDYDSESWDRRLMEQSPRVGPLAESRIYQMSPPTRFFPKFERELATSDKLRVIHNANLVSIDWTPERSDIAAFSVATLSGTRFVATARWFVLAMGGIENARMLLLANRLGGPSLGRYFMEHLHFPAGRVVPPAGEAYGRYLSRGPVVARFGLTADAQQDNEILGYNAMLDNPRMRLAGKIRRRPTALLVLHTFEQAPNPESRVTLGSHKDRLGLPLARLDWRTTSLDERSVAVCRRLMATAFRTAGFQNAESISREVGEWPPPPLQGFRGHHIGTTRMGSSPSTGVVDADCRVHGVANLFVGGSSVFATGGSGTPTLTIVALGLRLVDHILRLQATAR
jgi:choline dehydrogenase-like flavoprotein